jgi:hypothetical protein
MGMFYQGFFSSVFCELFIYLPFWICFDVITMLSMSPEQRRNKRKLKEIFPEHAMAASRVDCLCRVSRA